MTVPVWMSKTNKKRTKLHRTATERETKLKMFLGNACSAPQSCSSTPTFEDRQFWRWDITVLYITDTAAGRLLQLRGSKCDVPTFMGLQDSSIGNNSIPGEPISAKYLQMGTVWDKQQEEDAISFINSISAAGAHWRGNSTQNISYLIGHHRDLLTRE